MKAIKLTGAALDWAVAEAEGFFKNDMASITDGKVDVFYFDEYSPSTNWALGGAIIEQEGISLDYDGLGTWVATIITNGSVFEELGTTPLIAAMRCYVASCLGDDVELPDELDINQTMKR